MNVRNVFMKESTKDTIIMFFIDAHMDETKAAKQPNYVIVTRLFIQLTCNQVIPRLIHMA